MFNSMFVVFFHVDGMIESLLFSCINLQTLSVYKWDKASLLEVSMLPEAITLKVGSPTNILRTKYIFSKEKKNALATRYKAQPQLGLIQGALAIEQKPH